MAARIKPCCSLVDVCKCMSTQYVPGNQIGNALHRVPHTYGLPSFPNTLNINLSLQTIIFQKFATLFMWFLANCCRRFLIFFFDTFGFRRSMRRLWRLFSTSRLLTVLAVIWTPYFDYIWDLIWVDVKNRSALLILIIIRSSAVVVFRGCFLYKLLKVLYFL